jgi:hypothetical protein
MIPTDGDFQKLGDFIANKWYAQHHSDFLDMSMDLNDVKQEAQLCILMLKKNPKISGLSLPLVKKAVTWKMQEMIRNKRRNMNGIEVIPLHIIVGEGEEEGLDIEIPNLVNGKTEKYKNIFDDPLALFKSCFSVKKLQRVVPDKEYRVLEKRIIEEKTFEEIAKEIKVSKKRAHQLYSKAMERIKKRLLTQTK